MTRQRLHELLSAIRNIRIAVLGDFCLDAYWTLDPATSETSLETGKPTQPVRTQRYEPGGAANVIANLRALGVGDVLALGVVGRDPFAAPLRRLLRGMGVDTAGLLTQASDWQTGVFVKPHIGSEEQSRLDLGMFNRLAGGTRRRLLGALDRILSRLDALIINQQMPVGMLDDETIEALQKRIADYPFLPVILDSRDRADRFTKVVLKVNQFEALRLTGRSTAGGSTPVRAAPPPGSKPSPSWIAEMRRAVIALKGRTGEPVYVTCGDLGIFYAATVYPGPGPGSRAAYGLIGHAPAVRVPPPINPVGAGDAATAAIAAALTVGATIPEAATLANLAAAVTVRRLDACGVATPAEIVALIERQRIS